MEVRLNYLSNIYITVITSDFFTFLCRTLIFRSLISLWSRSSASSWAAANAAAVFFSTIRLFSSRRAFSSSTCKGRKVLNVLDSWIIWTHTRTDTVSTSETKFIKQSDITTQKSRKIKFVSTSNITLNHHIEVYLLINEDTTEKKHISS